MSNELVIPSQRKTDPCMINASIVIKKRIKRKKVRRRATNRSWYPVRLVKPIYFLSNDRITPITALEEKNIASKKPVDKRPVLGLFRISEINFIKPPLFFSPGITSLISENIWLMNSCEIGK